MSKKCSFPLQVIYLSSLKCTLSIGIFELSKPIIAPAVTLIRHIAVSRKAFSDTPSFPLPLSLYPSLSLCQISCKSILSILLLFQFENIPLTLLFLTFKRIEKKVETFAYRYSTTFKEMTLMQ